MNAEKEKYLTYETSTNDDLIENICVSFHDSKELNFFRAARKFKCYTGQYARVTSPKRLVSKENANLRLLVDEEGQFFADGKALPAD